VSGSKTGKSDPAVIKELCGACGLCCNGAIFADVQLRAKDDTTRLRSLGLEIRNPFRSRVLKFFQPCAAHQGCKCRIYSERPQYCREFECALLRKVCSKRIKKSAALRIIRQAKEKLATINEVLEQLGNDDQTVSHRLRFKQVSREMKQKEANQAQAALFSDLGLAVHEMNLLLAESFYPGQL